MPKKEKIYSLEEKLKSTKQKNEWLYCRIKSVKESPDGAKIWLRNLGKNDLTHAKNVEDYLNDIIKNSKSELSPEEIYLLLHSIYLHDIGYDEDPEIHPMIAHDRILKEKERYFINNPTIAEAIANICLAHGVKDLNVIKNDFSIDFFDRNDKYDLRFLGALLRLADDLDEGYMRVLGIKALKKSLRHYIDHIEVGTELITIHGKPDTEKTWNDLVASKDHLQKRLDEITDILSPRGIKLKEVTLFPKEFIKDSKDEKVSTKTIGKDPRRILFLLDSSLLGIELINDFRSIYNQKYNSNLAELYFFEGSQCFEEEEIEPKMLSHQYPEIVWVLGENFETPLNANLLDKIIENTANGGGLILFPFTAWSTKSGKNHKADELIPVSISKEFKEGEIQRITKFEDHEITREMKPFTIKNTYEHLTLKGDVKCLCWDENDNPFLVVSTYKKGKVVYINTSSHSHHEPSTMVSKWRDSEPLRELIFRSLEWAYKDQGNTGNILSHIPIDVL